MGLRYVRGTLVGVQAWGGTDDGADAVVGLDPATGTQRWRYDVPPGTGRFSHAPLWADAEGRVYAATVFGTGRIVCLEAATGAVLWQASGTNAFASELAHTQAGLRLFVNDGNEVVAYDADTGHPLWRTAIEGHGEGNLAYADGVVYHGHSGALFAFDAETGRELARANPEGSVFDVEADAEGGRLYVLAGGALEARHLLTAGQRQRPQ